MEGFELVLFIICLVLTLFCAIFALMETIETIIKKWKINKSLLAEKMGMTNTTFNKKLDSSKDGEFTDKELVQLKMILKEMCSDLEEVIEIDFNDAMSLIVKKDS